MGPPVRHMSPQSRQPMETRPASPSPHAARVLPVAPQPVVPGKQARGRGERRGRPGVGGRSPRVLPLERGQPGVTQPGADGCHLLFFYLIWQ